MNKSRLHRLQRRNRKLRGPDKCHYESLEARKLLAGVLGVDSSPAIIEDAFSQDAVTVKEMVARAQTHDYVSGELIVAISTQTNQGPTAISSLNWERMTGIAGTTPIKTLMTVDRGSNENVSLVQLKLGKNANLFDVMNRLDNFRRVMWSSPNFSSAADPREFVPNDPDYPTQWHHVEMENELAWDITLGSSNVVIAVTDDGVDFTHTDLQANMWKNTGDFPGDLEDNDGNGYIDDYDGWDFVNNNNVPFPSGSDTHGTHVSGIAAGRTNNGIGISGTAGGSKVMPVQFYQSGSAWTAAIINEAFTYAVDNGAWIINTSYNIDGWVGDPVFTAALQYVYDNDVLHFNSAGNSGALNPARQAFEQTLLVGSTENGDTYSSFSNYGTGVDISAPGGSILSTVVGNAYDTFSGTSMATPNAAGVAALIWSANPTWTRDQVAAQLYAMADNIDAQNPSKIGLMGGGRVNSFQSLTGTVGVPGVSDVFSIPDNGGSVDDTTIDQFSIKFDQIMDPASINNAANYELRSAGPDELFDTADDVIHNIDVANYMIGTNQLVFNLVDGPMDYGHYRLTVTSGGVANPFGLALDGNGDGTGGDDYVHTFDISPPPLGTIAFDRQNYQFDDIIEIVVGDSNAVAPVMVTLTSSSGDSETLTLSPSGFGKYQTTIQAAQGAFSVNDGVLQVQLGDILTATYEDADDGSGSPATVTDDALISNIRQYDSDDTPIGISDNTTFTSIINVSDVGAAADVDVLVDFTHTYDGDLDVFLIAPDGTRVELFTDVGGSGDNFTQTILDDEAAASITSGAAPFTGSFRPEGSLSDFDFTSIFGDWSLEVTDDAGGDVGFLNSWSLFIDVRSLDEGVVATDRPTYAVADTIDITVTDTNASGPISVLVLSTLGDVETVPLTSMGSGVFAGSLNTVSGAVVSGDGSLQVDLGAGIVVKYVDANDGTGNSKTITANANIGNVVEYPSSDIPVTITDNATFTSIIDISDFGELADVDVQLDITHTYDGDLDVFLIAPDGTRVELFTDVGGSGDNFTGTYIDDEAPGAITAGTAPFTGFFQPEGDLSILDGMDINGVWTLEISDDAGGDQGTLNSWSLFMDIVPTHVVPDVVIGDAAAFTEADSGSSMMDFVISLSEPTTRAVFVDYATSVGGVTYPATAGEDFTAAIGTAVFLPGETSKTIQVEVFGDRYMENHEELNLVLNNPDGVTILDSTGIGVIEDNETWSIGMPLDLGTYVSPVQGNAVGMMDMVYASDRGMGWVAGADTLTFEDSGVGTDLRRDYALIEDSTFQMQTGSGRFIVTLGFGGDLVNTHDNIRVWVQGLPVDIVTTLPGEYKVRRYLAVASGGMVIVRIEDMGCY
ncbi:MAG: S8 family serine peptidase [Pirellulaceae bacterium]